MHIELQGFSHQRSFFALAEEQSMHELLYYQGVEGGKWWAILGSNQ
jgi:hypothetical protein